MLGELAEAFVQGASQRTDFAGVVGDGFLAPAVGDGAQQGDERGGGGQDHALVDAAFLSDGISLTVEPDSDPVLFGFPNEYSQALMNLLVNARQAVHSSKVAQGRVTVRLGERGGQGCLEVQDNGGGIAEAILNRDEYCMNYITADREGRLAL